MSLNPLSKCLLDVECMIRKEKRSGTPDCIPEQYWEFVTRMFLDICAMTAEERERIMLGTSRAESGLLFGIAMGAAAWAVRERSPLKLRLGLLALILENGSEDYRESVRRLCVLNDSASRIGIDLQSLYFNVRQFSTEATSQVFDTYFQTGEKRIGAMGYEAFQGPDGFDYKRVN